MDNTGYQETQPGGDSSPLAKRVAVLEDQLGRLARLNVDMQDQVLHKIVDIMNARHKVTKEVFALHRGVIVAVLVVQVLMALLVVYKI